VASPPVELTSCNCSICRRYGVLWAYYREGEVFFGAELRTETYAWDDRSIVFHRCESCGCVTHWAPRTRTEDRIGVNARLFDPLHIAAARIRHLDGAGTEAYLD